jgi:hypothetical protein
MLSRSFSVRPVPNEGHVHLYLDGSLVSMTTALDARVAAPPGQHELQAEFVALDHVPFQPPVVATVTFSVVGERMSVYITKPPTPHP